MLNAHGVLSLNQMSTYYLYHEFHCYVGYFHDLNHESLSDFLYMYFEPM